MTLDDLRVFIAVYEAGNLSAVARDTGRTQSAVSQHVRRLERQTGLALLERRPRVVVPTQAGRILYEAAMSGMAALDSALKQLAELRDGGGGSVRVTTGGITVRHFMAEAITVFRERHPQVSLEFQSAFSTRRCIELLHAGRADLAWITLGQPLPGVELRPVTHLGWVLVAHPADPLAARAVIEPGDLADLRYIAHPQNSASRLRLEDNFARLGCALPEPVGVADWDSAILLAELGVGHAVLPALPRLAQIAHSQVRAVPIPALDPISVGWAARRWDALSPLAREFALLVEGHAPPP